MDWGPRVTYLASTSFKDRVVPFGIKDADRQKHVCILGKVGSGRGNVLARMALQDIERGIGTLVIDASGTVAPLVMERLTRAELDRLVHLDASDAEYPFSWNVPNEFRHSEKGRELFKDALASLYGVSRSPLTDFLATWTLADPSRTIHSAYLVLSDERERTEAFSEGSEAGATFAELRGKHSADAALLIENGRYLMKDTMVRNMIGQRDGKFSLSALETGSILILDLSRIRVFPTRVQPLVRLFTYALRAQTVGDIPIALYLHDTLRYLTESDADALLSDQSYALTLSDTVYREEDMDAREKALTKCGSVVTFTPHQSDVPLVQRIFYPYVTPEELQGLEPGEACVLLTIDTVRARPFFANTLDLPERKNVSLQDILVESRKKYTTPRTQVEDQFKKQPPVEKKGGTPPPFNDAFKNIFAKRDPANFLTPSAAQDTKVGKKENTKTEDAKSPPPPAADMPVPPKAEERKEAPKEVSEDDLRALLSVPLPA